MRKRMKLGRRHSRKLFRRTANRTHKRNLLGGGHVMRGGIRM